MPIPTWVAAGSYAQADGNITPGMPSGHTTNDILILVIETSTSDTCGTPSGWAHVTGSPLSNGTIDRTSNVFWKRHDGSETAPTTTGITVDFAAGQMYAFRGCTTSGNPWDVIATSVDTAANTSLSWPTATTTVTDTLVALIRFGYDCSSSGYSNAALGSITERADNHNTTPFGWSHSIALVTGTKATTGAIGATTGTTDVNTRDIYWTIALKSDSTVQKNGSDTAVGTDASSISSTRTVADTGSAVDAGTVTQRTFTATDTGAAADASTIAAAFTNADTASGGGGSESIAPNLPDTGDEQAFGTDASSLTATLLQAETLTFFEGDEDVLPLVTSADTVTAAEDEDIEELSFGLSDGDTASVTDTAVVGQIGTDTGSGVDASSLTADIFSAQVTNVLADSSSAPLEATLLYLVSTRS